MLNRRIIQKQMGMRAKKQTQPQLTIRIQMKSRLIFVDLCTRAKNLYNYATYQVRQEFFATGKWLQYTMDMIKIVRQ